MNQRENDVEGLLRASARLRPAQPPSPRSGAREQPRMISGAAFEQRGGLQSVPGALVGDPDRNGLVPFAVNRGQDGPGGLDGDLVLTGPTTVNHADAKASLLHRFSPERRTRDESGCRDQDGAGARADP